MGALFRRFFTWLLDKAGGGLVGAGAKWLWGAAGGMLSTCCQIIYGLVTGHPNLAAILIGGGVPVAIFTIGAIIVKTRGKDSFTDIALPPLPQGKLSLEILEGYAGWKSPDPDQYVGLQFWVLLKVRVINRSEPSVRIKEWKVDLPKCHDGEYGSAGFVEPLPRRFSYRPKGTYDTFEDERFISEDSIVQKTATTSVSFGSHEDGFLLVRTYIDESCRCFGFGFTITVTDSLDGVSSVYRPPDEWLKAAELKWPAAMLPLTAPYVSGPQFQ